MLTIQAQWQAQSGLAEWTVWVSPSTAAILANEGAAVQSANELDEDEELD